MRQLALAKNKLLILYKLLGDLLFLLLAFFSLALIADGLLSGLVSSHISFLKIICLITLKHNALYAVGRAADVKITEDRGNRKTTIFLVLLAALLIGNSLFQLNHYLALFILAITLLCSFFLYRLFFEK